MSFHPFNVTASASPIVSTYFEILAARGRGARFVIFNQETWDELRPYIPPSRMKLTKPNNLLSVFDMQVMLDETIRTYRVRIL